MQRTQKANSISVLAMVTDSTTGKQVVVTINQDEHGQEIVFLNGHVQPIPPENAGASSCFLSILKGIIVSPPPESIARLIDLPRQERKAS